MTADPYEMAREIGIRRMQVLLLRQAIQAAPHADICAAELYGNACDCWKVIAATVGQDLSTVADVLRPFQSAISTSSNIQPSDGGSPSV